MRLTLAEIAGATGGDLKQGRADAAASSVSTDSRGVKNGEAFFALKGPNFDGHAFVSDAAAKGAAAAIVEDGFAAKGLSPAFGVIAVGDTLRALGDLACFVRTRLATRLLAISGSSGKTTTKEMAAAILSRSRRVLKTEGNLNNLIGLPLTLLRLDEAHEAAVVELGISEPGEMGRLVEISRPDVALLTNIGRAHLERLQSVEGVAEAKGPLFTQATPEAVRVVNLDDPHVVKLAGNAHRMVTFSMSRDADVRVRRQSNPGTSPIEVAYEVRGSVVETLINSPSAAAVINGAAAIAAAIPFVATAEEMAQGLASYTPSRGRMEVISVGGVTVIDDSYNANPDSVSSALHTLAAVPGRKVAVLGEMFELGGASAMEHERAGKTAASLGVDVLVAVGGRAKETAAGAMAGGMRGPDVVALKDNAEALCALEEMIREGDTILVKGSRRAALDEIVSGLRARTAV